MLVTGWPKLNCSNRHTHKQSTHDSYKLYVLAITLSAVGEEKQQGRRKKKPEDTYTCFSARISVNLISKINQPFRIWSIKMKSSSVGARKQDGIYIAFMLVFLFCVYYWRSSCDALGFEASCFFVYYRLSWRCLEQQFQWSDQIPNRARVLNWVG